MHNARKATITMSWAHAPTQFTLKDDTSNSTKTSKINFAMKTSVSIAREKDTLLAFALTIKTKDTTKIDEDPTGGGEETEGATEEAAPIKEETQSSKHA
jgi:hypothetical protein